MRSDEKDALRLKASIELLQQLSSIEQHIWRWRTGGAELFDKLGHHGRDTHGMAELSGRLHLADDGAEAKVGQVTQLLVFGGSRVGDEVADHQQEATF